MSGDRFYLGPRYVGHGEPGVDEVWHLASEPCSRCEAEGRPTARVTAVDADRGVVTIEAIDDVDMAVTVKPSGR